MYQKEYLEFFLDPRHLDRLKEILQSSDNISYILSNRSGSVNVSNWSPHASFNTLSWALFPSKCVSSFNSSSFCHAQHIHSLASLSQRCH